MEKINGNSLNKKEICLIKLIEYINNDLKLYHQLYQKNFLIRFCKYNKYDLDKTKKMFDEFLIFRKTYDIDNILKNRFPDNNKIMEFIENGYIGIDKLGRPIYVQKIGKLDIDNFNKLFNNDENLVIKYYINTYEMLINLILPICSEIKGKSIKTTLTIIDIREFSLKKLFKSKIRKFLKIVIGMSQKTYPEWMGNLFIIHNSKLFSLVWKTYKPFIDKKQINKIKVLTKNYKEELLKYIDEDQLPKSLGGNFNKKYNDNYGPWKEKLEECIIKQNYYNS